MDNNLKISPEKREELTSLFKIFDKDSDGFLNINEYEEIMKLLNVKSTSKDKLNFNNDINYKMDLKEFLYNYSKQVVKELDIIEELKEAFKIIDQDKDSYINAEDFRYFMSTLGDSIPIEECEEIIKEACSKNGNSNEKLGMNFEEFIYILNGLVNK